MRRIKLRKVSSDVKQVIKVNHKLFEYLLIKSHPKSATTSMKTIPSVTPAPARQYKLSVLW
jgi:hypothetical protein